MTSNSLTFTGDQRFSAHFEKPNDDRGGGGDEETDDVGLWTLQVRNLILGAVQQ